MEYPLANIFRTAIDGSVKGSVIEKYLTIPGIPSNGQKIPKNIFYI